MRTITGHPNTELIIRLGFGSSPGIFKILKSYVFQDIASKHMFTHKPLV